MIELPPDCEECPSCRAPVEQDGPTQWEGHGTFQLVSTRRFVCACGQKWEMATDGG